MKSILTRSAGLFFAIAALPAASLAQWQGHSADTSHNNRISVLELTRVIELYNTRYGTVRSGCYVVDSNPLSEDGFAPDPNRDPTYEVTLSSYHSADSNHDGKIGLLELTRAIELYNYRVGTTRTGDYHAAQAGANTEDGFVPGPVGTQQEQSISFNQFQANPEIPEISVQTAPIALGATASSGLSVTYSVIAGAGSAALVNNLGTIRLCLLAPGTVTLRASQAGNADVAPANPVDRTFLVVAANNSTQGENGSLWFDANGDGILDEIIRPNTSRFRVSVSSTQFGAGWYNNYWTWRSPYFDPEGPEQPTVYTDFAWVWDVSATLFSTIFDAGAVDVSAWLNQERNYDYLIFETANHNLADWTPADIDSHSLHVSSRTVAGEYNYWLALAKEAADLVGVGYYPIRLSKPVGSLQISDQAGNILVGNAAVAGPAADLWLPANGQVTLQVRDTANNFLPSTIHQIGWKIQDALGTILREGLGVNVDFDGLPLGELQLAVVIGAALPKVAQVKTKQVFVKKVVFTDASQYFINWNGNYADTAAPGQPPTYFSLRGWESGGANEPVTVVDGIRPTLQVTVQVTPAETHYVLRAYNTALGLTFVSGEQVSTGSDQVVTVQSNQTLPNSIAVLEGTLGWAAAVGDGPYPQATQPSGPHKIYVTWEPPRADYITWRAQG